MSGLLDQRAEVFAFDNAGGRWQQSRYTRVPNWQAEDHAWWAAVEPISVRERQAAAQSQSEADFAFTFLDEVGGLTSDGLLRYPAGAGNRLYKINGEPRVHKKLRRVSVLATHAGDDVVEILDEGWTDPRRIIAEAFTEFNVPAAVGAYAPERLLLLTPTGGGWMRGRFTREAAVPAGAVCEEWALKTGGDPANDADYFPAFSLMTSNFVSVAFGPRTAVQVRIRSGGTPGIVRVHATCTQFEPIISEQAVTYNVPAVAGQYAPEYMQFSSVGSVLLGHLAVVLETVMPAGTVMDVWALRTGGDPSNEAHYFPAGNFLVGTGLAGNPIQFLRTVRLRAKSGGVAGAFTVHGLSSMRTGRA